MALGDLFQTMKKPHSIVGDVDRYLLRLQGKEYEEDKDNGRMTGVWSPSELSTQECIRALVYGWLKTPKSDQNTIRPQIRKLFDVGHHFGYQMQAYFWDMGILFGKWHCTACEHKWKDMENPSPRKCPNCGVKSRLWYNLRYDEVDINIDRGNRPPIAGHADGVIVDPKTDSKKRLIELKTIKSVEAGWTEQMKETRDYFQKLNSPLLKHNYQANIYMHGTGVHDGVFIYGNKNDQMQKEFLVRLHEPYVKHQYVKIDQTERALDQGYLPARISSDKNCEDCKWCKWKTYCHSTEHGFAEADHRKKEVVTNGH